MMAEIETPMIDTTARAKAGLKANEITGFLAN